MSGSDREMDVCKVCGDRWPAYSHDKATDMILVRCTSVGCGYESRRKPRYPDTKPWVWSGSKRS